MSTMCEKSNLVKDETVFRPLISYSTFTWYRQFFKKGLLKPEVLKKIVKIEKENTLTSYFCMQKTFVIRKLYNAVDEYLRRFSSSMSSYFNPWYKERLYCIKFSRYSFTCVYYRMKKICLQCSKKQVLNWYVCWNELKIVSIIMTDIQKHHAEEFLILLVVFRIDVYEDYHFESNINY